MADEQVPNPGPAPAPPWFTRLGLSGKLLAAGGLVGVVAAFLPLASVSVEMGGPGGADSFNPFAMLAGAQGTSVTGMSFQKTVMVVDNWRGKLGLLAYLAALILAVVLYPPNGLGRKTLAWAGAGAGLLAGVLAVWLLVLALDSGSADLMGMGRIKSTVGVGAFVNLAAGAAVAAGGFLKAREEKLV